MVFCQLLVAKIDGLLSAVGYKIDGLLSAIGYRKRQLVSCQLLVTEIDSWSLCQLLVTEIAGLLSAIGYRNSWSLVSYWLQK